MINQVKFLSTFLVIPIVISCFCGFKYSDSTATSSSTSSSTSNYITKSDCDLLANNFILTQVTSNNDADMTWNKNTTMSETIPLYDLNDNVNSYIFNLTTNGKTTGYLQVSADINNPCIIAFGYDGKNSIESALNYDNTKKSNDSALNDFIFNKSKLYYVGGDTFLSESSNHQFYDIKECNLLNYSSDKLKNDYDRNRSKIKNQNSINQYKSIKDNGVDYNIQALCKSNTLSAYKKMKSASVSTGTGSLVNLFSSDMDLFITSEYQTVSCASVAGLNIVEYWGYFRNRPKMIYQNGTQDGTWISTFVQNELYKDMKCKDSETTVDQFNDGLITYGKTYGYAPSGSDCQLKPSYSWVQSNISNQNIFGVAVQADTKYSNHEMVCVGWTYAGGTSRFYLRVADGWSSSKSNFYNYDSGYVSYCSYSRW